MRFEYLIHEISGHIATIKINRPKALNALNGAVLMELGASFHELAHNEDIRVIVLTGEGEKAFVAGADINAMSQMTIRQAADFTALGHSVMNQIESIQKPVIAAVNGFALGGGLELALACDFIYASETALLALPETSLGLFPGFGGTQRLSRLIGKNRARELIYSAAKLTALEALACGIVNRVCPAEKLIEEVLKVATAISANSPVAIALAKEVINRGTDLSIEAGLLLEKNSFPTCFGSSDMREGLSAFLEKRKPQFTGR